MLLLVVGISRDVAAKQAFQLKILDVRIGMSILLSIVCNENELML